VLGALAIIIAVLIVINSHAESAPQQAPPTVTDTGNPPSTGPAPATKTPTGAGPGLRDWTDRQALGNSGFQSRPPELSWVIRMTPRTAPPRHGTAQ